jgi:hypothetical protein
MPIAADFNLEERPLPKVEEGALLLKVLYVSLDPASRLWMSQQSYGTDSKLGEPLPAMVLGRVVISRCPKYVEGDLVSGMGSVAQYSLLQPSVFTRVIRPLPDIPETAYLNALGYSGLTAYNGLVKVCQPSYGETVLVSGAAGSVGSLVGQIAKHKGCTVVGVAGGEDKCKQIISHLGFDRAINYQDKNSDQLIDAVKDACEEGIDIFFDNVGGEILDAALANINVGARLLECGMIAQYNEESPTQGPRHIWQLVAKSATMYGFLNRYHSETFDEAQRYLEQGVRDGWLRAQEHVERGLQNFYPSYMHLFNGTNRGKLLLAVD